MTYTISQVAERMGVSPSAIRYYDKEGLLPEVKRNNGIRIFDEVDLGWLRLLICLKNTGMPIKRIREYVELSKKGDSSLNQRYELIRSQRQYVMEQMEQLEYYLAELDFKDWYYHKAMELGSEKKIDLNDYEKETGKPKP